MVAKNRGLVVSAVHDKTSGVNASYRGRIASLQWPLLKDNSVKLAKLKYRTGIAPVRSHTCELLIPYCAMLFKIHKLPTLDDLIRDE